MCTTSGITTACASSSKTTSLPLTPCIYTDITLTFSPRASGPGMALSRMCATHSVVMCKSFSPRQVPAPATWYSSTTPIIRACGRSTATLHGTSVRVSTSMSWSRPTLSSNASSRRQYGRRVATGPLTPAILSWHKSIPASELEFPFWLASFFPSFWWFSLGLGKGGPNLLHFPLDTRGMSRSNDKGMTGGMTGVDWILGIFFMDGFSPQFFGILSLFCLESLISWTNSVLLGYLECFYSPNMLVFSALIFPIFPSFLSREFSLLFRYETQSACTYKYLSPLRNQNPCCVSHPRKSLDP